MKKVKLDGMNGTVTTVEIKKGIKLHAVDFDGAYSLCLRDYTGNQPATIYLKDGAKKLSTINKYANKYGIEFVR